LGNPIELALNFILAVTQNFKTRRADLDRLAFKREMAKSKNHTVSILVFSPLIVESQSDKKGPQEWDQEE
jgi:hypothetical protein